MCGIKRPLVEPGLGLPAARDSCPPTDPVSVFLFFFFLHVFYPVQLVIDVQRNCRIVRRVRFECRGQEERYLTDTKPTTPALARKAHGAPPLRSTLHHCRDAAIGGVGTKSVRPTTLRQTTSLSNKQMNEQMEQMSERTNERYMPI